MRVRLLRYPVAVPGSSGAKGSISYGETATPVTSTHCTAGVEVVWWRFTGSRHVGPGSTLYTGPKKNWVLTGSGHRIIIVNANESVEVIFRYELPAKA